MHGGWTSWTLQGRCNAPRCETGTSIRSRSCTNPRPRNGGRPCVGRSYSRETCVNDENCPSKRWVLCWMLCHLLQSLTLIFALVSANLTACLLFFVFVCYCCYWFHWNISLSIFSQYFLKNLTTNKHGCCRLYTVYYPTHSQIPKSLSG